MLNSALPLGFISVNRMPNVYQSPSTIGRHNSMVINGASYYYILLLHYQLTVVRELGKEFA